MSGPVIAMAARGLVMPLRSPSGGYLRVLLHPSGSGGQRFANDVHLTPFGRCLLAEVARSPTWPC